MEFLNTNLDSELKLDRIWVDRNLEHKLFFLFFEKIGESKVGFLQVLRTEILSINWATFKRNTAGIHIPN